MKALITILSLSLLFSCTKQQTERTFGADKINKTELSKIQIIVSSLAQFRKVKPPRNPPTDTVVTPPKDTVVVAPPVVVPPVNLPSSTSLHMPPVENQGNEGSCVAFSLTYARSYEAFKRSGATSYSQSTNILSPEYLFNQTKTTTSCSGSALLTALNFLKSNGVCTWASMPYTWSGCSLMPTSTQTTEAANFRILGYSQIYASDVTAIKTMLVNKRPMVCQIAPDNEFLNAGPSFIWKSFTTPMGTHAIAVVGYDDSKNAFKIINSWGISWGDAGYGWIDYGLLKTVSSNLFVLTL